MGIRFIRKLKSVDDGTNWVIYHGTDILLKVRKSDGRLLLDEQVQENAY